MKIAVVILNWNGKKLLERFLPTVVNHSKDATIYVADNASTDDSVQFIKTNFPTISIIQNTINGGYAKGYNESLKTLKEDLFILLNNDVAVTPGWLTPICNAFKNDTKLVAAQPKLLDYNNKEYFEYAGAAGGFLDQLGYPFCRGRIFDTLEKDTGQYNDTKQIFWASGACFFVKKSAFWDVNGFDEDLFAHQEEIDLCWRMQLQGGIIKYVGESKVYHLGGGTLQNTNPKKTFFNFRNSLLILLKNNPTAMVWGLIIIRLLLDGVAGFYFLLKLQPKNCLAIIKAHLSFYYLLPKFLQKRQNNTKTIKYYFLKSIVWQYYIRKKRIFAML
jgi:hypothetical protein